MSIYEISLYLKGTPWEMSIYILPLAMILLILIIILKKRYVSVVDILLFFSIFPATSPIFSYILGYEYFTALNHWLQYDDAIKLSAIILILAFSVSIFMGSILYRAGCGILLINSPIVFPRYLIYAIFIFNFFLIIKYLEPSTIIFTSYGDIKLFGAISPYSSFVNQIFNASVAVFLFSHRNTICDRASSSFILFIFILLSIIFSRRTMSVGLMVLLYYYSYIKYFNIKSFILFIAGVFVLWFIGEARQVGVYNYIFNGGVYVEKPSYFILPGGASNIFVGTMGVVDMIIHEINDINITIPYWIRGVYEGNIYESYGYDYNGGFHIVNIAYWNFGILGVFLIGAFLGYFYRSVHENMLLLPYRRGMNLFSMISISSVILLPNIVWYHPIGELKLSFVIFFAYSLFFIMHKGGTTRMG